MTTIASAPGSSVIVLTMFPEKSKTTIALLRGLETKTWLVVPSTTKRPNPATGSLVTPGCAGHEGDGPELIWVAGRSTCGPASERGLYSCGYQPSSHSVTNLPLAWMSICRSRPLPEFTNLCGTPGRTIRTCPAVASTVSEPTVNLACPSRTMKTS